MSKHNNLKLEYIISLILDRYFHFIGPLWYYISFTLTFDRLDLRVKIKLSCWKHLIPFALWHPWLHHNLWQNQYPIFLLQKWHIADHDQDFQWVAERRMWIVNILKVQLKFPMSNPISAHRFIPPNQLHKMNNELPHMLMVQVGTLWEDQI